MKEIALITCSGVSNTGKLTEQAAKYFAQKYPGAVDYLISAKKIDEVTNFDREDTILVLLEGCDEGCVLKKLAPYKIKPDIILRTTELGVVKHGMDEPVFTDIEKIAGELNKSIRDQEE